MGLRACAIRRSSCLLFALHLRLELKVLLAQQANLEQVEQERGQDLVQQLAHRLRLRGGVDDAGGERVGVEREPSALRVEGQVAVGGQREPPDCLAERGFVRLAVGAHQAPALGVAEVALACR
jgi:hypothetical protein